MKQGAHGIGIIVGIEPGRAPAAGGGTSRLKHFAGLDQFRHQRSAGGEAQAGFLGQKLLGDSARIHLQHSFQQLEIQLPQMNSGTVHFIHFNAYLKLMQDF